jgi:hypothetical protein
MRSCFLLEIRALFIGEHQHPFRGNWYRVGGEIPDVWIRATLADAVPRESTEAADSAHVTQPQEQNCHAMLVSFHLDAGALDLILANLAGHKLFFLPCTAVDTSITNYAEAFKERRREIPALKRVVN